MTAVAKVLGDPQNAELTAEEVAERVIETLDEKRSKTNNLIVLGHFHTGDGPPYIAAVGPLSTRAVARARGVGQQFAWDYKSRSGTGKFMLVPLVRTPNEAWDEARAAELQEFDNHLKSITEGVEPSYEAMRFDMPDTVRSRITAEWQLDPEILAKVTAPSCTCGLREHPRYNSLGQPATTGCPRHPKGRDGGQQ